MYKGHMNATRRFRLARSGVVLAMALSVPLAVTAKLKDLEPPIGVRVAGRVHYLSAQTSLTQVISGFRLHATAGNLVDVEGSVLQAGLYPGRILLNGREAAGDPSLRDGDIVAVQNGRNHSEPTVRQAVKIPGGEPGNPQFFLGTSPGEQLTIRGKISGKIVSSEFKPTGPASRPLAVALTFDDGPGPYTARVLQVLQRFHVRATFFVIGYVAAANPDLVRREAGAGMVIGNHSWDHPNSPPFRSLPQERIREEIGKTTELLSSLGITTSLFRPPGGSYSQVVIDEARRFDSRVALWDVDPKDWQRGRTRAQIVQNVLANVRPGAIVDLHDAGGDRSATIAALPAIIRGIRARGLELVPMT
jgi:peptidoglycan/xylan/chitin deacetylase (PgdA/CDA1 family)